MIITVAGNIGIPITRRNKEIVDKYGISFNEDDTLESVRDQFSKVKKQHRKLRRVYDTLNRTAVKSIHQYAAKRGGGVANLIFDDVSSVWKATMFIDETKEDEVVVRSEYIIHKKIDQSFKSCVLERASLENMLKAKVKILQDVYQEQLKVMLTEYRIDVTNVENHCLRNFLKKSRWNLERAKEKAISELSWQILSHD